MVHPKDKGESLTTEDYLWPLTTIRDTLLRPDVERQIPHAKVRLLLKWHLARLQKPWEPFKPASSQARTAIQGTTVQIPGTDIKMDIDAGSRSIALRISDAVNINEITSFLLWKSYTSYSVEEPTPAKGKSEEDAVVDRLLLWYEQELLAVPQIVMALYVPASQHTGWEELAAELRPDILGDQASFIESLFRAFGGLAQKPIAKDTESSRALYLATLQLRQQETLLDLLFLILYQFTTRPAAVSEGLIKGTVLSGFGTAQANGEIWQNDEECQRLQYRIRDLLVVIAVEAMCLAQILSPEANDEADTFGATLLHSRDRLHAVHSFIMEQTEDLAPGHPEAETVFPHYPTPILCLAWAVVLRSLPPHLQPPSGEDFQLDTTHMSGDDPVVYLGAATRALRLSSGLFPWFESILQGPLFEATKDAFSGDLAVDMASLRRSPIKDLLIGLSELIHIQSIADHPGLYSTWVLLFGGGVQEASTSLANNYWAVDYAYDDRRAILDHSLWPREPTYLPRILAALTGVSSDDEVNLALTQVSPVPDVFDYVNELPFITITSPHSTFTIAGEDDSGRTIVEATVDFELPGGAIIPRRARGTILSEEDAHPAVVSWRFRQAGWSLLIEILRGAVGLPASPRINNDARRLELVDLGVQSDDLSPILSSGLKLLRSVLRSSEVASLLVRNGSPGDRFPGQSLLELALAVLTDRSRPERSQVDFVAAKHAIDILQSLLLTGNEAIWQAFRASGFFDSHSRRQGSVASLIQSDGLRGKHGLTAALLRLVRSLASANAGDAQVVRSAVKLVVTEVWSQFSGWRYQDISKRYEIASLLIEIFDIVLRHPLGADGKSPSPAAAYLFDVFVNNTSPLSYRPIVDVFTQSSQLATRFVQARRWSDAEIVYAAFDHATSLLSTLLRLAPTLKVSVNALPFSLFASTIVTTSGDKIQLVDHLFDLIFQPSLQPTGLKLLLRLLRVYLATSSSGSQRPSLAGMLRNPNTLNKIATVAVNTGLDDVKPDAWALLGTIIATQPGCAAILIPSQRDGKLAGLLKHAVDEVQDWKLLFAEAPSGLAAVLGCVQSVLESASASNAVSALRSQASFWQAVHDIAVKFVALPSSFSDNIAADVHKYSYAVQAKANATSLLAAELALTLDADDETETKTQALVVSLLRNTGALEDTALAAVHTSCDPAVHANEAATIKANGVNLAPLRTINLPEERQYGIQYLYDGVPVIFNDSERQVSLNRSIAILNLNWSQLDADVNYTKAWRLLLDIASTLTSGDALVSRAAVRAANAIAGVLADEDRGGDVMLAIQTERLSILATLLDIALDPETEITEPAVVKELANSVRRIVESTLFPPIISLRHSELPPIHRPVLRVLLLLSQAQAGSAADEVREVLFDSGATFALDAANIVLDTILLQTNLDAEKDLSLIVALLCEMSRVSTSTAVWLDKLMQVNLIPRSLDVIVRTRPVDDTLPPHFHTILLLHLAIASNGPTAEKLAVSGVLPAYADNVVAVAAEAGRIDVTNANDSFHRAWCELLQVVTALLSSLPDAASFARSDAVPFVRVVLPQLLHGLQYTGAEQPLSAPALEEMELVADVFYGLSNAVKPGPYSLLLEFAPSAMVFLRSAQHAVSHPHIFSSYIIPSSEEEQAALEKERTFVGDNQDISAADHKAWPTVASRMDALMRVTRTILVALVRFTHAWASLGGDREPHAQFLLPYDDEHALSTASDPIGVLNDLFREIASQIRKSPEYDATDGLQAMEAAAMLSLTQLCERRILFPAYNAPADDSMDIDIGGLVKRRVSFSTPQNRYLEARKLLESDLQSNLNSTASMTKLLDVLRTVADREFPE